LTPQRAPGTGPSHALPPSSPSAAMAGQMWEVVGGGEKGGIVAREGKDLKSAELLSRVAKGSLIRELELVGERLHFELVEGEGPNSGWVSLAFKGTELVVKCEKQPPKPKKTPGTVKSVVPTQNTQTPGEPFFFYHQITFLDTKPTGMRMSGVFGAMDETRMDMHSMCDHTAESLREVVDPHVELGMELMPVIKQLSNANATDGMLYTHPDSRGAVQSWVRIEAEFGFPMYPFKTEEQNMFLVGKKRESAQRLHIARARFYKAFVEDKKGALVDESFQEELDLFYDKMKKDHVSERVAVRPLKMLYEPGNKAFTPTAYKKVRWLMSFIYSDLWGLHYHGRTSEVLWDVNMLAGSPFAELVQEEPDPQAMSVHLPKKMDFGKTFDVHCFLEVGLHRAVYVVGPEGFQKPNDVVLCVCARYAWEGAPADGKTLVSEDFEVLSLLGMKNLLKYVYGEGATQGRYCDTTQLPAL